VLLASTGGDGLEFDPLAWLARERPGFARLGEALAGGEGIRLLPELAAPSAAPVPASPQPGEGLELLLVERTFGTEELSAGSAPLQKVEEPPYFLLHPDAASRLGLKQGDRIAPDVGKGEVTAELRLAKTMAPGVAILPRHRALEWQKILAETPVFIEPQGIRKREASDPQAKPGEAFQP
jgi:NADH-quinone oxidoreductase subunit G